MVNEILDLTCACGVKYKGEAWRTFCHECFKKQKAKEKGFTNATAIKVHLIKESNPILFISELNTFMKDLKSITPPKVFYQIEKGVYHAIITYEN